MSCSPCKKCYDLAPTTPGSEEGIYCVIYRENATLWFGPDNERVTDAALIAELFTLLDTAVEQEEAEVLCTTEREYFQLPVCDVIDEFGLAFNIFSLGGGNFEVNQINVASASVIQVYDTIAASDLNALGFDAGNSFLYAYNRNTAELWRIDISVSPAVSTNLGTVTAIDGTPLTLPGVNYNFGAFDPVTGRHYIGGTGTNVVSINVSTLEAQTVSSYTLPTGAGDLGFDSVGRLYASGDGVITRFDTFLSTTGVVLANVADNGSGFGGSFGIFENAAGQIVGYGNFGDQELWSFDLTSQVQTNSGSTLASTSFDFANGISPRYVEVVSLGCINEIDQRVESLGLYNRNFEPYVPVGNIVSGECPKPTLPSINDKLNTPLSEETGDQTTNPIPSGLRVVTVQCVTGQVEFNGIVLDPGDVFSVGTTQGDALPSLTVTALVGGSTWNWGGFR